ncbi:hypothetical protein SETIT_4G134000v2 [Setaria italica]|uniref:Uncharacterized protein n=1 Tax=Setaria italica TaxID=4555 RepID=A0A368QVQ4_SETIT|nr:hypothetical protein SETIT_4G134000v2 [Setaria italica]
MAILWDVLEQVVWDKEVEVSQRKARAPLQRVAESTQRAPLPRDIASAAATEGSPRSSSRSRRHRPPGTPQEPLQPGRDHASLREERRGLLEHPD